MTARKQIILLILALGPGITAEGISPIRDQWQLACKDLAAGRAAEALHHFQEFNDWYGEEPEVKDPEFHEGWIRLWGLAALQSGSLEEAATLLERWFSENPQNKAYRAFLRFQLVGIYQSLGLSSQVSRHRDKFLQEHQDLPECALIRWGWADEAIRAEDYPLAIRQLRAVINTVGLSKSGQSLAEAALALVEMSRGSDESAMDLLSGPGLEENQLVGFWKALAAPTLAQKLMATSQPAKALKASSWFDSPERMVSRLDDFGRKFRTKSAALKPAAIRQNIWNKHWETQLDRLRWSLDQQAEDLTLMASLYALRLRVLLEANQPALASTLGRAILESPEISTRMLRAASFKAIIESSIALKDWKQAEAFANRFRENYPDDPALPEILFLNARTAASRKEWARAISQMEQLFMAFPTHASGYSWKMLYADWLLQSGNPGGALRTYSTIADGCPPAWRAFVTFHQGRCQEALSQWDKATGLYKSVKANEHAPANLREFALTSLLKLFLKRMSPEAFTNALMEYRSQWKDGMNHLMVENLAGMFFQRSGNLTLATSTYKAVASGSGSEANFAKEQLSLLYRDTGDIDLLRKHALEWIESDLLAESKISETPLIDCGIYQEKTRTPALPESLLQSLRESLEARTRSIPVGPCLDLISQLWDQYRQGIPSSPDMPTQWIESMVHDFRSHDNWSGYAAFQLYLAQRLEEEGRLDSADTRRIEVLQAAGKLRLGENADFILSQIAHKYDFPEAEERLEMFLSNYPESPHQPQAILCSALRKRRAGQTAKALSLAGSIVRLWPDAKIFIEAALLFSRWSLEDRQVDQALAVIDTVLNKPGLSPVSTAEALFIRAEGDFHAGNTSRGFLNCLRILTLYPDIHDKADCTINLLGRHLALLPEGDERRKIESKLCQSLQPQQLERLQLNEV
ncbi:hypothetical protein G0Q06_08030 [Puniceicoccales bacterium CK1056]|uniref:Tetratricopeptide repeat protein n=1 Tax=Oceanipulchritudo coccoides TaxID=2706888 RepID=A0A6B2M2P7_9BACT|nr:hypothetical protein [Oceanipulchritudo coccoides]NDV62394.1 hypothetical protein [Oceanipulchritudo coccoides]